MASQATRQRKGAPGAPKSGEALVQVSNAIAEASAVTVPLGGVPSGIINGLSINALNGPPSHHRQHNQVIVATVKRNKFGTSPFDENWLNIDCCGLICACITYMLHAYGVYATCLVLIPPWMSTTDEGGARTISVMGHLNRLAFTTVAVLAVYAHFKAMTTDPGAVPPDAVPLEDLKVNPPLNGASVGDVENGNAIDNGEHPQQQQTSSLMQEDPLLAVTPLPARKGKRLCRRCNAFKPKRAHHCSICKRCIIKMDRKWRNLDDRIDVGCRVVRTGSGGIKVLRLALFIGSSYARKQPTRNHSHQHIPSFITVPFSDHCPWVNNCVGIGNHKYFLLFVFYTCLSCVYSLTLIAVRFFVCMGRHGHVRTHHITCLDRPTQMLTILGLFFEAVLFGLFTSCMMIDQAGVVTTKLTHIDRLKGGDEGGSSLAGVVEVFGSASRRFEKMSSSGLGGSSFRADWLSPFHRICFPTSLQDEIMGFCRPCVGGSGVGPASNRGTPASASGDFGEIETDMQPMIRGVAEIV